MHATIKRNFKKLVQAYKLNKKSKKKSEVFKNMKTKINRKKRSSIVVTQKVENETKISKENN